LCPTVARDSFFPQRPGDYVGRYIAEAAARRDVQVTPLSSFAMRAKGAVWDIRWLQRNYRELVCGFDTRSVVQDKTVYMACMADAPTWIRVVASAKPETLMADQYGYVDVCVISDPVLPSPPIAGDD